MNSRHCSPVCSIIPPYILQKLLESADAAVRHAAMSTLLTTAHLRGARSVRATLGIAAAGNANGRRTIFDCRNSSNLANAVVVRSEEGEASSDDTVNRAFDGLGTTREFYKQVFNRNSIDGRGGRLDAYVHFDVKYNNAQWDGQEMLFGDGDGQEFTDFTKSLDVIGHELTHGVTQETAALVYHNQQGALNESMSDVFGSLIKQWSLGQTAEQADWLIGMEIFTPGIDGDALRSMKAPGTAYDNEQYGKDPQPDHMSKFVHLPDTVFGDSGGVHYNSGIPNKAFYLTAKGIGGSAWLAPGHIWYESLLASNPMTDFQEFANTTYFKAGQLYGPSSNEQQAVVAAWKEVGIQISGIPAGAARVVAAAAAPGHNGDSLAALTKQFESLAGRVKAMAREITTLKAKK